MFSCKENRKGRRYFLHRNSLAGYSTVSAAKSAAAPRNMTGQPEKANQTSLQRTPGHQNPELLLSLSHIWCPLLFSEGAEGKERTRISIIFNFYVLYTTVLRGRHTKQFVWAHLEVSPAESCSFVGQQLCYQQALTAATAIIKLPLPFPAGTSREWKNKTETKQKMRTRECFRNDFS